MTSETDTHLFSNWAKERLDEIEATLAALQARVDTLQAGTKTAGGANHRGDTRSAARLPGNAQKANGGRHRKLDELDARPGIELGFFQVSRAEIFKRNLARRTTFTGDVLGAR